MSDLVVAHNCCVARILPGEAELVLEWTGLPRGGGGAKSVKRKNFEWFYGLDTALYKNYLYIFSYIVACCMTNAENVSLCVKHLHYNITCVPHRNYLALPIKWRLTCDEQSLVPHNLYVQLTRWHLPAWCVGVQTMPRLWRCPTKQAGLLVRLRVDRFDGHTRSLDRAATVRGWPVGWFGS